MNACSIEGVERWRRGNCDTARGELWHSGGGIMTQCEGIYEAVGLVGLGFMRIVEGQ